MGGCVGEEGSQAKMALQWLALVLLLVGPTCAQTNSQNESWPVDGEYMEYLDDQDVLLDGDDNRGRHTPNLRRRIAISHV
jgi:hypothetical protein